MFGTISAVIFQKIISSVPMTWIEWFCSLQGNEGICIIPQSFLSIAYLFFLNWVADSVNVYGLKYTIDNYSDSMRVLTGEILGLRIGNE